MKRLELVIPVIVLAVPALCTMRVMAQSTPITPDVLVTVLETAKEASTGASSPTAAATTFALRMKDRFGEPEVLTLSSSDSLDVALFTPMALMRVELFSMLRKMEPTWTYTPARGIAIDVQPKRIDSPDIIKVIVTRNGSPVAGIGSTLQSQVLTSAAGAAVQRHVGAVFFPAEAFAPGGRVHVSAIPENGTNIEYEFTEIQLQLLNSSHGRMANSLIGKAAQEVAEQLGWPSNMDGHRWTYITPAGRLSLHLDEQNIVDDVQPTAFDLAAIRR
jgi:hypothetical protein